MSERSAWASGMDDELERLLGEYSKLDEILKYFRFTHLREGALRDTSRMFAYLTHELSGRLPRCPERTVAFRKLLEGKDAAVRACL